MKLSSSRLVRLPPVVAGRTGQMSSQTGGGGPSIVSSDLADVEIPAQSWSSLCWSQLAQFSRQTVLVDGLSGRSYSLAEARELASQTGNGLLRWRYFLETFIITVSHLSGVEQSQVR